MIEPASSPYWQGIVSGVLGVTWLALLWRAAGVRMPADGSVGDRLRLFAILGVGIPFVLGFVHLLNMPACFISVLALGLARGAPKKSTQPSTPVGSAGKWYLLPCAAVLVLAFPSHLQPPADGDTLIYHLPNALTWVQHASVWTTGTRYWWYPGGSELFASGLIAVGGAWLAGISGTIAILLLATRLSEWGVSLGTPAWLSATIATAFVCGPVAASQAAGLQNDLWLAAFVLESLWLVLRQDPQAPAAVALLALLKPIGAAYALATAIFGRWRPALLLAFIPWLAWLVRVALLWNHAIIPANTTYVTDPWSTSVLAHGVLGLLTFLKAATRQGPETLIWCALPLIGLCISRVRQVAIVGLIGTLLFAALPFGFASSTPQLLNGASLRFDLPAMAVGAVVLQALGARAQLLIGCGAALAAIHGAWSLQATYFYGANAVLWGSVVASVAIVAAALLPVNIRRATVAVLVATLLVVAATVSRVQAVAFYNAGVRDANGRATAFFTWLDTARPRAVVGQDIRLGAVGMISPDTTLYDALDVGTCDQTRRLAALLVVGRDSSSPETLTANRHRAARFCGSVLYDDGAVIVVSPN